MKPDTLFLIRSDFNVGDNGPFFCPGCVEMLGLLEAYPVLKDRLTVRYVDFARPRPQLVDLLGEENQGCPVLVLSETPSNLPKGLKVQQQGKHSFVEGTREIADYLAFAHGSGKPYPPTADS